MTQKNAINSSPEFNSYDFWFLIKFSEIRVTQLTRPTFSDQKSKVKVLSITAKSGIMQM
jgi:hypothetical protein